MRAKYVGPARVTNNTALYCKATLQIMTCTFKSMHAGLQIAGGWGGGFHHSLTSLVACQHPSIWVLLKSLQRQQALTDNMLSHIAQGESKLPGTRERARNARIATHVSACDRSDPEKNFTRDCI